MKWKVRHVVPLGVVALFGLFAVSTSIPVAPTNPSLPSVESSGFFKTQSGVVDAETREMVVSGDFNEVVANNGYMLITSIEGKLSLTDVTGKKAIQLANPDNAYQLKAVGDDFGYLQQVGEKQYITFLDPKTGKTSAMKTEHNVIKWDTQDEAISYHLYDTGTLGFATYDGELDWRNQEELDADIDSLGNVFSSEGEKHVWVLSDATNYEVYSFKTREVSKNFPVVEQVEDSGAVLAEIMKDHLIVTAPIQDFGDGVTMERPENQVWDMSGEQVFNFTMLGYESIGEANADNDHLFFPVSYTNSETADGVLVVNADTYETSFADGMQSFIKE